MIEEKNYWIFAYKCNKLIDSPSFRLRTIHSKDGVYYAEEIVNDLDKFYDGLEYGDVFEGEYQLWEYPSGKIFKLTIDREVVDKYYYTPPHVDLWLPKLILLRTDKNKVEEAYKLLSNSGKDKSFVRTSKKWHRPWETIFKKWFKK